MCRTSQEGRGLKYERDENGGSRYTSHLTRGAWIEIIDAQATSELMRRRTSHEVRGLKLI